MTEREQGQPARTPGLERIETAARRAERRLRARKAVAAFVLALCVALAGACMVLVLRKTGRMDERPARVVFGLLALIPVAAGAIAFARRLDAIPLRAGALALDRFHALADRLSSALTFVRAPEPTPFMLAAIDDAVAHTAGVDPRRAVPLRAPPHVGAAAGLALAFVAIALFEVRHHVPAPHAATIDAVDVTADDLDAMREFLAQLDAHAQTDDAKAATREFNQLIEDLAARRLDRTEAFRRMQQLEDKLLQGREADAKALEEAMKKIGEELKLADLTKPAGEALDTKNLVDAEKQLRDLAKKLREQGKGLDKSQLDKMRQALERASSAQAKRQEALAQRREELRQQLLAQKNRQPDGGAQDEEKSLLQKRERELERLDRDTQQAQATQRQLDRLDRELAQAAEDLMKDMGMSAQDLEQGAEDINRMQQQEMSQEEKEQLRQKLQELREMMRQQGQGGQGQMQRLRRFQMQARGGQGQGQGGQQGQGQDGQGQEGQGQQANGGQDGQGQEGQGGSGQQKGQGQGGQGRGGSGETWILGPNGEKLLMLTRGSGGGSSGTGGNGGEGGRQPGPGYGTGHDGHVQGAATGAKVGTEDTQVAGQDTGEGASRSEVIEGAAERGFASRRYQKVFREYQTVAEEALGKDEIPGGYRFYVRRYFELIRPRDAQETTKPPAQPTGP
ncbi:MAG TPA: hypothetical protein VGI39_01995 [Polyangiaceae bacterium]